MTRPRETIRLARGGTIRRVVRIDDHGDAWVRVGGRDVRVEAPRERTFNRNGYRIHWQEVPTDA